MAAPFLFSLHAKDFIASIMVIVSMMMQMLNKCETPPIPWYFSWDLLKFADRKI